MEELAGFVGLPKTEKKEMEVGARYLNSTRERSLVCEQCKPPRDFHEHEVAQLRIRIKVELQQA